MFIMKKLFILVAFVLSLSMQSNSLAMPENQNLNRLIGTYVGSYTIPSAMKRGLKLTVYRQDGRYEASFEFYGLPGRAKSASGKYFMTVDFDVSKNIYLLHGYEWADRPGGYIFVDLKGDLDNKVFSGDVLYNVENPNSICGTFYLERVN